MTAFATQITRCPLPFDSDAGAEAGTRFSDLAPELREVLAGAAGCSPYLRRLMGREADWLRMALVIPVETVMPEVLEDVRALADNQVKQGLRQAKARMALFVGLADLAGVWNLAQVTGALTEFADLSVDRALKAALAPLLARNKVPGQGPDDLSTAAGMVALAMGKMGAGELNYSSDIDLIMLFDDSRFEGAGVGEARAAFIKATRTMTAILSDITGDGYVWRTDLRLRPDPSVTPVCLSMEAAERYYESLGRTWERAAHIKARPAAGDLASGAGYLERLRPFVWRRHLDFASVQDAHDMRLRIRAHRGLHDAATLEGRDIKLGPGGIREIEFFTQTRQIIAGGRDASLRLSGTEPALIRLAETEWIEPRVATDLRDRYRHLREVEHRLQMVEDARTQKLPTSAEGWDRIARMCGYCDTASFRSDLSETLAAVAAETEDFFAPTAGAAAGDQTQGAEPALVERWRHYPALRSTRAQEIFARLKPDLLARLNAAARPEEALAAFDGFLSGLPSGVQLFSMFEANPALRALITDIAATAPALARYLSRHATVLDAVIGGSFFEPVPGKKELSIALSRALADVDDFERALDEARRWQHEWHFRIGVHHLRGLIDAEEAGAHYAQLAEACICALLPVVTAQHAAKHGPPPGRGATVLAMGSLGAGWINAGSDLDVIVIYDPQGQTDSVGKRPLATRPYYARLTQALVTALAAPTAAGRMYEVDMRLRPSGRQGPVATALPAFEAYQRDEAWTWEHLALTRARAVAWTGPEAVAVGAAAEAVRASILADDTDASTVRKDVGEMRARLLAAKPSSGPLDVKPGPGGLQDLELMAQAAALLAGATAHEPAQQLLEAADAGCLSSDDCALFCEALTLYRAVVSTTRLSVEGEVRQETLAAGPADLLLREGGAPDLITLVSRLDSTRASVDASIVRWLAMDGGGPE